MEEKKAKPPKPMTRMPNLTWLRAFEASARHLNFTSAAQELNMTQPAVSKQVRLLELHLNEDLFIRKARNLELTSLGRAYLVKVQDGMSRLKAGTDELFSRRVGETITIKAIESFSISWLLPKLKAFYEVNPDTHIRLLTSNWANETRSSDIDFEISYGFDQSNVSNRWRLTNEKIFPVGLPKLLAGFENGDRVKLLNVLGYSEGWTLWLDNKGLRDNYSQIHVDSSRVAYEMASEGIGIALGRSTLVAPYLSSKKLVSVSSSQIKVEEGFFLICHANDKRPNVKFFLDWMLTNIESNLHNQKLASL